MPSVGYHDFAEANYAIGLDDVQSFAREDCRHFYGMAKRYVRQGGILTDDEVLAFVRVIRRADALGMTIDEETSEEITEILL